MAQRSIGSLASIVIQQERVALAKALRSASDAFQDPVAGSTRAQDQALIASQSKARRKNLEGLSSGLLRDTATVLLSQDQFAQALQIVLTADEMLPLPASTLVRSIHEAAITLCRLFDSDLTTDDRMARMGGFLLATAQGSLGALEAFPPEQQVEKPRITEAVAGIRLYLQGAGYEVHEGNGSSGVATGVTWGSVIESLRVNTTAASKKYMPEIHYNWVTGSGATHSKLWYSKGIKGPWETLVIGTALPLLDISDALVDALLGYVGLPTDDLHRGTHRRRISLFSRLNAGEADLSWEDYLFRRRNIDRIVRPR